MSLGLERCPPARPHWQGQRGMAAKVLTADAAGGDLSSGSVGKLLHSGPWARKAALRQRQTLSPCAGLCPSAAWRGRQLGRRLGGWGLRPARLPSLTAELTLDKQLQSIYLGPYGVGEQVCGNEEPSSN